MPATDADSSWSPTFVGSAAADSLREKDGYEKLEDLFHS